VLCELRLATAIAFLAMRLTADLWFATCSLRLAACKPTGGIKSKSQRITRFENVFMQVE